MIFDGGFKTCKHYALRSDYCTNSLIPWERASSPYYNKNPLIVLSRHCHHQTVKMANGCLSAFHPWLPKACGTPQARCYVIFSLMLFETSIGLLNLQSVEELWCVSLNRVGEAWEQSARVTARRKEQIRPLFSCWIRHSVLVSNYSKKWKKKYCSSEEVLIDHLESKEICSWSDTVSVDLLCGSWWLSPAVFSVFLWKPTCSNLKEPSLPS